MRFENLYESIILESDDRMMIDTRKKTLKAFLRKLPGQLSESIKWWLEKSPDNILQAVSHHTTKIDFLPIPDNKSYIKQPTIQYQLFDLPSGSFVGTRNPDGTWLNKSKNNKDDIPAGACVLELNSITKIATLHYDAFGDRSDVVVNALSGFIRDFI